MMANGSLLRSRGETWGPVSPDNVHETGVSPRRTVWISPSWPPRWSRSSELGEAPGHGPDPRFLCPSRSVTTRYGFDESIDFFPERTTEFEPATHLGNVPPADSATCRNGKPLVVLPTRTTRVRPGPGSPVDSAARVPTAYPLTARAALRAVFVIEPDDDNAEDAHHQRLNTDEPRRSQERAAEGSNPRYSCQHKPDYAHRCCRDEKYAEDERQSVQLAEPVRPGRPAAPHRTPPISVAVNVAGGARRL
jgi:hypothetical protein